MSMTRPFPQKRLHKETQMRWMHGLITIHDPSLSHRTDQLLADIDDMLADLSTHLDFMIPGSS